MTIVRTDTDTVTHPEAVDSARHTRSRRLAFTTIGVVLVAATLALVLTTVQRSAVPDANPYDVVELNRAGAVSIISRAQPQDPFVRAELNRFQTAQAMTEPARDGWSVAEQNRAEALAGLNGTPVSDSSYDVAEKNRMAVAASLD